MDAFTSFIRTNGYNDSNYLQRLEQYTMPEETKQPEWITLSAAAEHKDCQVSRQALWNMIQRGDVPAKCLEKRPYGKRTIYYINANCLATLDYRDSGQRGKARDKNL